MLEQGRETFRYDTFGSEGFWTNTLQLHRAIAGAKNGGVGDGVSPETSLAVGLKVDAEKIPTAVAGQIKAGKVDLKDPATTLALLNAVCARPRYGYSSGFLDSGMSSITSDSSRTSSSPRITLSRLR